MMRYVLYESQSDFLPISKEIGFIKNYISLMKLRLSENVKLELNIIESGKEYMIAPLVLIAFVENAFKHCSLTVKGSFIKINIEVKDDTLIYSTANTMGREKSVEENHSGVGLANLQKRLSLLYGNDYTLSSFMKDNVFHSSLELKLKG
jgi:LytS/YehU family sensor histidine kinase